MTTPLTHALQPILSRVRTDATAVRQSDGIVRWTDEPLTEGRLLAHLTDGVARGCCPIKAGQSTVMLGLFDLDSHKGEVSWSEMSAVADRLCGVLEAHDLMPIAFRSGGGNGMHIYLIWDQVQDAYSARRAMTEAVEAIGYKSGTGGLGRKQIEVFPKQNSVAADKFGNMFVLPLSRASVPLSPTFEPLPRDTALTLAWPVSAPVPKAEVPAKIHQSSDHTPLELQQLESALAAIPQETDPLTYDDWFRVVCAIHHETEGSDDGLALVHAFSERSPKHDADFLDNRVWPYLHDGREQVITGASILHMARTHGWNSTTADDFDDVSSESTDPDDVSTKAEKLNKFRVKDIPEFLSAPPLTWWIKGVLPAARLAMIYGKSGSGKTFIALDMAIAMALGRPWRGGPTKQGRVVFVCAEGVGGFRNRIRAAEHHYGIKLDKLIGVIDVAPNLLEKVDAVAIAKSILEWNASHGGGAISAVFIDTMAQVMAGGNENAGEDVGTLLSHCNEISRVTGAITVLIHHSGKDEGRGSRGWSGMRGACDAEYEVTNDNNSHAMKVTKMKDGDGDGDYGYKLLVVPIGMDEAGDVISSCVVEHTNTTSKDVKKALRKPGKHEITILEVLNNQMIDLTAGIPEEVIIRMAIDATPAPEDGKDDRRRDLVTRALSALKTHGAVRFEGGKLYLPDPVE